MTRPDATEDFSRCAGCGDTLIQDGTEEADWSVYCEWCREEMMLEQEMEDEE